MNTTADRHRSSHLSLTRRLAGTAAALGVLAGALAVPAPAGAGPLVSNGKIAFNSGRSGNPDIWAMNPDGSNPTNLTKHPATDYGAAWSPDGTMIAFVSNRHGRDGIFVMKADGSNPTMVTPSGSSPTWSPDGKRIAFTMEINHSGDIFVVDLDGKNLKNITNTPANEADPAWSPLGTRIAYWKSDGYVWTIKPDGNGAAQLSPVYGGGPAWSPDGKKIAFNAEGQDSDIHIMDLDGSLVASFPLPGDDVSPTWSPDGKKIAFEHRPDDGTFNYEIFVINTDGTNPQNLTNADGPDTSPTWQKKPGLPLAGLPPQAGPPASTPPPHAAQPPR